MGLRVRERERVTLRFGLLCFGLSGCFLQSTATMLARLNGLLLATQQARALSSAALGAGPVSGVHRAAGLSVASMRRSHAQPPAAAAPCPDPQSSAAHGGLRCSQVQVACGAGQHPARCRPGELHNAHMRAHGTLVYGLCAGCLLHLQPPAPTRPTPEPLHCTSSCQGVPATLVKQQMAAAHPPPLPLPTWVTITDCHTTPALVQWRVVEKLDVLCTQLQRYSQQLQEHHAAVAKYEVGGFCPCQR